MSKHNLFQLLAVALMISGICISFTGNESNDEPGILKVEGGLISGIHDEDSSVMVYWGIPFAAPPLGDLRWREPQPVIPWKGVKSCSTMPASAMQNKPEPFYCWSKEFLAPQEPLSEDCLYLNIWSGAKSTDEKRAVIVWIHGGAFTGGSGTVPLYNGAEMAKKGVVFVTINYRLGIFGFLAHPELSAESASKVSGNYGILDQIAALKWVKRNIQAFGGDPDNVTIAGQSAGAMSVNILMASPLAKGLFQRAIAQSGGMFGRKGMRINLSEAEKSGKMMEEKMGVHNLAGLRSLSSEKLQEAGLRTGVVIDNFVVMPASDIFSRHQQNDVPLLTGWNADDGVSFALPKNARDYQADVQRQFNGKAALFLQHFPASNDSVAAASQKIFGQLSFGWQNYYWAFMESTSGKSPSFLYYFSHVPPGLPNYGAFHSAEFGYALKTLKYWNRPFTAWDFKLSDLMSSYWVNFAKNGDPNGNGLPVWPAFSVQSPQCIHFGEDVKASSVPYLQQLEFITDLTN